MLAVFLWFSALCPTSPPASSVHDRALPQQHFWPSFFFVANGRVCIHSAVHGSSHLASTVGHGGAAHGDTGIARRGQLSSGGSAARIVVCCSGLPTHRVHVPIIFPASLWVVFRIVVPMRTCLRCRIDFWPLIARGSLPPGAVSSPRKTKKTCIPFEICPSGRSMTI